MSTDLQDSISPLSVAAIQMVSTPDVAENLAQAGELIDKAVAAGARLVALPEYFCHMGRADRDKLAVAEEDGAGPIQDFLAGRAARHGIWLAGGTLPLRCPDPQRVFNSSMVFGPDGRRAARYDKIHLFNFKRGDESYDESIAIHPGSAVRTFDTPTGPVGMSVCYDLRFPELYRAFGPVSLVLVPSAFTYTTGRAHWELLLRARAIENQCYMIAVNRTGEDEETGTRFFGHSMIVDPWGEVVLEVGEPEGVYTVTIDLDRVKEIRRTFPVLDDRRL